MTEATQTILDLHPLPWTLDREPVSEAERVSRGTEIHEAVKEMDRLDPSVLPEPEPMSEEDTLAFHIDMEPEAVYVIRDSNGARVSLPADSIRDVLLATYCGSVVQRGTPPEFAERVGSIFSHAANLFLGGSIPVIHSGYFARLETAVRRAKTWVVARDAEWDQRADEDPS